MKKIICGILAFVLMISLSACKKNYTHGEYKITIKASCVENNTVGNEWSKCYYCDGIRVTSGDTIIKPLGSQVIIRAEFTERDKYSDRGSSTAKILLEDGTSETFDVRVVEDNGAYDGNIAIWKVKVTIDLIKKKTSR